MYNDYFKTHIIYDLIFNKFELKQKQRTLFVFIRYKDIKI